MGRSKPSRLLKSGLAATLVVGALVIFSYFSTARVADGDFQPALAHVTVVNAVTGTPIEGVSVRGQRNSEDSSFLEFPTGPLTDRTGRIELLTPSLRYGYHGWKLFWIFWVGTDRTHWALIFEHPGYRPKTVSLEELVDGNSRSSGASVEDRIARVGLDPIE